MDTLNKDLKVFINVINSAAAIPFPGSDIQLLQIQSQKDFILTEIRTSDAPLMKITITDSEGNILNNIGWDADIIGAGTWNYQLREPILYNKNSQFQIQFDNFLGAPYPFPVQLLLIGYLIKTDN
jgi:hypothetical protein